MLSQYGKLPAATLSRIHTLRSWRSACLGHRSAKEPTRSRDTRLARSIGYLTPWPVPASGRLFANALEGVLSPSAGACSSWSRTTQSRRRHLLRDRTRRLGQSELRFPGNRHQHFFRASFAWQERRRSPVPQVQSRLKRLYRPSDRQRRWRKAPLTQARLVRAASRHHRRHAYASARSQTARALVTAPSTCSY